MSPHTQVMYDKSGSGKTLRQYVHVSLALWHNYKWATGKILSVFGADFIAPFFHDLFPDKTIDTNNMSHSACTTLLSYMRLSYSSFRQQLINEMNSSVLSASARKNLSNLFHLFEFFIPVVSLYFLFDDFAC